MKKLSVVGIGPGAEAYMTLSCRTVLAAADVIVGYAAYIDLVKPLFPEKDYFQTGMMKEAERCREALRLASEGRTTAMVCSGDAVVYGMAGLIYELLPSFPGVTVEVIPGVTAALSASALLGAPLTNDFAVISLSDLLTPAETIRKRLDCAAAGDFCIALYNPSSKRRADHLAEACRIIRKYRTPETVCGYVQNIGRTGECFRILTLAELETAETDMFTTVLIGNSQTRIIGGKMVTPRGYHLG